MQTQPLFSIIIPVYNTASYLSACLDSLIAQSNNDFEAICVNDGSSDSSLQILEQYATRDARIKCVNQVNAGVSVARNHGIDLAKGRYLLFLDSDDILAPNAIELISQELTEDSDAWVMFGVRKFYEQDSSLDVSMGGMRRYEQFPAHFNLTHRSLSLVHSYACNKIFSKTIIEKYKLRFREGVPLNEDMLLVFQYSYYVSKVRLINDDLYLYRMRDNSVCGKYQAMDRPAQDYLNHVTMYTELIQQSQGTPRMGMHQWQLGICMRITDTYRFMCQDMKDYAENRPELLQAFKQAIVDFKRCLPLMVKLHYLPYLIPFVLKRMMPTCFKRWIKMILRRK